MRTIDRAYQRPTKVEERLSIGQSAAVITGLSVLSWGVVILFGLAARALV